MDDRLKAGHDMEKCVAPPRTLCWQANEISPFWVAGDFLSGASMQTGYENEKLSAPRHAGRDGMTGTPARPRMRRRRGRA